MIRKDEQDLIYKSEEAKWNAVADDIIERNENGPADPGGHGLHREVRDSCRTS